MRTKNNMKHLKKFNELLSAASCYGAFAHNPNYKKNIRDYNIEFPYIETYTDDKDLEKRSKELSYISDKPIKHRKIGFDGRHHVGVFYTTNRIPSKNKINQMLDKNHIVLEGFKDDFESEYGKFMGIDITDISSINFTWSNLPHFSDYKDSDRKYGDPEKRIDLTEIVRNILSDNKMTKNQFKSMLEDDGFQVDINQSRDNEGYRVTLNGQDVIRFFHLIEELNS